MRIRFFVLLLLLFPALSHGQIQTYYQYKTDEARLVFFDKNLSRYIPHCVRLAVNFSYARRLSANPIERICAHL